MSNSDGSFSGLTEAQQQAVTHINGSLLVLAGPGSGKTTVVTHRIAHLIGHGVPPWQILALTFTNKAAQEMRDRVDALLGQDAKNVRGLTLSTFHAFCARVLRDWGDRIIGTRSFSIYDMSDQKSAVKAAIRTCELNEANWKPASVLSVISNAKNKLIDAEMFEAEASDFYSKSIATIYRMYTKILRDNNAVDFDDLLLLTAQLLHQDQEVKQSLSDRYHYLIIDEYQDTNHAQFVIADHIAHEHRNICVVGDPDQSIYTWRGADITNILDFERQYGDATVIPLGRNFRSTGHIVKTSATLIEHNRQRKEKKLFTELDDGERPIILSLFSEHEEADAIVKEAIRLQQENVLPKEMAVLYRVNALSRVLEEAFRDAGIPYIVARGTAFYDRKEIKQSLSYFRLIVNPRDDVAFSRVINMPTRGIGATSALRLEQLARTNSIGLLEATAITTKEHGFTSRAVNAMHKFATVCKQWRIDAESEDSLTAAGSLVDLVERVIRESGLEEMYAKGMSEEDFERVQNLEELVSAVAEFEERTDASSDAKTTPLQLLADFLENVALVSDTDSIDPESGAVTLMTLHAAKGLEYDFVSIAGLEEGLLPHQRAMFDDDQMEEERRLCYVGITRARRHLLLTSAKNRTQRGIGRRTITSRFIREMSGASVQEQSMMEPWDEPDPETIEFGDRSITVGTIVRHKRFGNGEVQRVLRRPRGSTVTVQFQSGTKHLVLEYANLVVVSSGNAKQSRPTEF